MARRTRKDEPLPTIWNVPDELWELIAPILDAYDPRAATGRPRTDPRKALDGIIYRLRSGVQWNKLPREFGDDSSVHRTFQLWVKLGVLERIWAVMIREAAADRAGAAASVPGQGLRQCVQRGGAGETRVHAAYPANRRGEARREEAEASSGAALGGGADAW